MAEKYEFNFQPFGEKHRKTHTTEELIAYAKDWLTTNTNVNTNYFVKDLVNTYDKKKTLTDSQIYHLTNSIKSNLPEYKDYEKDFFDWYDSREDIQEVYKFGVNENHIYVRHPNNGSWLYRGGEGWDVAWESRPPNAEMFWRVTNNWNVRKFKAVNAESPYEEGDLVVLRSPFIGHHLYDPLYTGRSSTVGKEEQRIGTIMQMTKEVHRNSRAGNGSRLVNVLWVGKTEIIGVPERTIKLYERKRRTKKKS